MGMGMGMGMGRELQARSLSSLQALARATAAECVRDGLLSDDQCGMCLERFFSWMMHPSSSALTAADVFIADSVEI